MQVMNPSVYYDVSNTVFCLAKYFEEININGEWYLYEEVTDSLIKKSILKKDMEEKDV